jgi:hypothetical protein
MGEMGAGENQFTGFKCFYAVPNKAGACSFQYYKQLVFRMGMPYRIKVFFL